MRYFLSVLTTATSTSSSFASPEEMEAIDAFNAKLEANGHWVFGAGVAGPDAATVVDGRGEQPVFTDGPYAETKEYVAGFWVIDAPDLDVALELAAEGSKACNRRLEVRPFLRG